MAAKRKNVQGTTSFFVQNYVVVGLPALVLCICFGINAEAQPMAGSCTRIERHKIAVVVDVRTRPVVINAGKQWPGTSAETTAAHAELIRATAERIDNYIRQNNPRRFADEIRIYFRELKSWHIKIEVNSTRFMFGPLADVNGMLVNGVSPYDQTPEICLFSTGKMGNQTTSLCSRDFSRKIATFMTSGADEGTVCSIFHSVADY